MRPSHHQHGARDEGQPPAPAQELGLVQMRQRKEGGGPERHAKRETDLHDAAVEAAPKRR
jgi:hypothetical protein